MNQAILWVARGGVWRHFMHFGKRQNHLANELALWRGQLKEGVKGLALQITNALFPTLVVLSHRLAHRAPKRNTSGSTLSTPANTINLSCAGMDSPRNQRDTA